MWAAATRLRGVPLNVMLIPWLVSGRIDSAMLCAAVSDLCARHATLRSILRYDAGVLRQVTHAAAPVHVQRLDPSGTEPAARLESALDRLRAEARTGVDVERGPVLRAWLFALAPDRHLLAFVTHHAMCDGWSTQIMLKDLVAAYRARALGNFGTAEPVCATYAELAAAVASAAERDEFQRELAYWERQLAAPPSPLALPTAATRKGQRDFSARSVIQVESSASMAQVRAFARARRASPFAVMLSALAVLLRSQTGAEDMLIGVSTLNRWSPASRHVVGCFTTILPARLCPRSGLALDDLVARTNTMLRELLAYGRVPFELILRHLQAGSVGTLALPVWCQLLEPAAPAELPDLEVSWQPLRIERVAMQCEIEFDLLDAPEGLQCDLAHRAAFFDPTRVEALGERFRMALRLLCAGPAQRVDELVEQLATASHA